MRRGHFVARRYGDSLPRHSAGGRDGLHDHQLAGRRAVGHVPGGGRTAGRRLDPAFRHSAERHPERVHRPEGVHFPAPAIHAAGHRYHRIRRAPHPAVQPYFHQRLSHSRSRFHGRAGTGIHPARRHGVRRLGPRARSEDRRIRAATEFLFQRPQRLLRRDRQIPRRPQDLGACHARALRRRERAQYETAFSRPDRRMLAHLAAAVQQRGAHRAAGHGRGVGRRPIVAHQLARRSLRAARRAGRHHRAAHPAGAGLRKRRHPHTRPVGRQLFSGETDARYGSRDQPIHPAHRRNGRHGPGH